MLAQAQECAWQWAVIGAPTIYYFQVSDTHTKLDHYKNGVVAKLAAKVEMSFYVEMKLP